MIAVGKCGTAEFLNRTYFSVELGKNPRSLISVGFIFPKFNYNSDLGYTISVGPTITRAAVTIC
jgi:hypothetical protein